MLASTRTRVASLSALAVTVAAIFALTPIAGPAQDAVKKGNAPPSTSEKLGVLLNDPRAFPGYNLINPSGKKTYLFDNEGRVVHTWTSEHASSAATYLLDNGHLFRPAEAVNRKGGFQGPAAGGRIQEFDWDGNLVWDFEYHSEKRLPHHDAIKLPNGNALLICWEKIDEKEAVAKGRRLETVKDSHLQPDCLVEVKPTGKTTGEVVWEWRSWDHLIQDRDKTKPNFGNVAEHPELFDVNYIHGEEDQISKLMATKDGIEKLRALGYVGSAPAAATEAKKDASKKDADKKDDTSKATAKDGAKKDKGPFRNPDWMHVNAVAYNADLDQIVLSSPNFHEIWIIDHSTSTDEAKGHTGGRWGKGGDILYRWGNPRAYRNGTKLEQRLYFQHNIQWIPKGLPGAGHLLVFNNGAGRKPLEYSAVEEIVPPTDKAGNYIRDKRGAFGPSSAQWSYSAPNKKDFFSWFISGAQRLPNGNTLINSGAVGVVFEVTPENDIVWKFANPFKNTAGPGKGGPPKGAPSMKFEVAPKFVRDALDMKDDQRKKVDAIEKELNASLEKTLSAEQRKALAEPNDIDLSKVPAGEYLSAFGSAKLKLTDDQAKELQALRSEFNPKFASVLTDEQKRKVADLKKGGALAAAPGAAPRVQGNTLFRATRYALNHPAFNDRTITPGKSVLEVQQEIESAQKNKKGNSAQTKTPDTSK